MKRYLLPCLTASIATLAVALHAQQNTEELARRRYESGLSFMQNHQYAEALKDFNAILESLSTSAVADDALLQIASYELDVAHDVPAAQRAVDTLLKQYAATNSAPMAHVLAGRLALARGRTPREVEDALASFERVPRLFPGDDAVPAAGYFAADTLRRVRRNAEALDQLRRVIMGYPQSNWAARAGLAAGRCLVQSERPATALEEIQRTRLQTPGSLESAEAVNENTVLYRLYIRPPGRPAYGFSGRSVGGDNARFKDVIGMMVDGRGQILLGHKDGVSIFDSKGTAVRLVRAEQPSTFFIDRDGRLVIARKNLLVPDGAPAIPMAIPQPDGKSRPLEEIVSAVVFPSSGDRLVADRKSKAVSRLSADGKYLGTFANVNAERLALNELEDVAIIDRDAKAIVLLDRDGKALGKIPAKGQGYALDNPVDISFDAFGHLYVLDRGRSSILVFGVFGQKSKVITTVSAPEKAPGAFPKAQTFALDAAGRILIFDDRAQRVLVYQ